MQQDLEKHIVDIFNSLGITAPFQIYNCKVEILPEWTKHISLTSEFVVCCQDTSIKKRLQGFTGKSIFECNDWIYWFEGESVQPILKTEDEEINNKEKYIIERLKTETRLPTFLDDFIFTHLNAIYAPDFQHFDYNLNLTKEDILKYLGTYFPRSYAESFCIFDNIFQNRGYQQAISEKESYNILSVGCGTGGDIIGLITIIEKFCPKDTEINIWAIDGNTEALSVLEQILNNYRVQIHKKINLRIVESIFNSISDIDCELLIDKKFDFILSFKFICEIISMGKGNLDNSYYDFIHKFLPMLSKNGLCILLDVTTKPEHTTYNPILMNRQVNQALRELDEYKTLLPLPCGIYSMNCYFDCFQQQTFTVTHMQHIKDKSKVAYRIIVHNDFRNKFGFINNDSRLLISKDKICPHTETYNKKKDAYLLEQTIS